MPSLLSSPSHKSPSLPLSVKMLNQHPQIMAPQEQWETFSDGGGGGDDDETLSLCDLPVRDLEGGEKDYKSSAALDDFEFRTCGSGLLLKGATEARMCAADDIFYRGQLLPLRMSLSSPSYGSQSDPSLGFSGPHSLSSNSIDSSSNCNSSSISRSQSCSSHSSNCDAPRLSTFKKFHAHPSRRPQIRTGIGPGRKGTGSALPEWAVFRLGVVRAPEIVINDLRSRQLRSSEGKCEAKVKKSMPRFGFGCTCTPDVLEPVSMSPARPLIPRRRKKKEEVVEGMGIGLERRRESVCKSSRMVEWLDELSIGKGSALGQEHCVNW